jgi:hypothetical protein
MTRHGSRQRQKDFILDQNGHIEFSLMREKIPGVILQFLLRQITLVSTNSSRLRSFSRYAIRLKTALAT